MQKYRVGILGATGAVGQQFLSLLDGHPWFEVVEVAASDRSAGKPYRQAAAWQLAGDPPEWLDELEVVACKPNRELDFVFSGLDSAVAGEIEWQYAGAGIPVISNARNYRQHPLVPLLIPEVNPDHVGLIPRQRQELGLKHGCLVTNPNCATVGLVLGLFPLWQAFGLRRIVVTTLQAISGAGYPGVPALDITANVLPDIAGEAEKLMSEPQKILGRFTESGIQPAELAISAQCNRVPVVDGHLISVSVELARKAGREEVAAALSEFVSPLAEWNLPSAPQKPIFYTEEPLRPQPRKDVLRDRGMTVTVGQLRPCPVLDWRLVILVHNTVRGAAGGAILNAEWLHVNGMLPGHEE